MITPTQASHIQEGKNGFFILRGQPVHNGHLTAIKEMFADDITRLFIGIGSANKEFTADNPFTFEERRDMLALAVKETGLRDKVTIVPVPDVNNNERRYKAIQELIPKIEVVYTGNPRVAGIFKEKGDIVKKIEIKLPVKATHIRNQITQGRYGLVAENTSDSICQYLQDINATDRLKYIYRQEIVSPKVATDLFLLDQHGRVPIITRKYAPYGYALPGGMVDFGEHLHDAAIREGIEEIFDEEDNEKQISLDSNDPWEVKSDPLRDPRGHVITFGFTGKITGGAPKANDDAATLTMMTPAQIRSMDISQFAFPDHYTSLIKWLSTKHDELQPQK